MNCPSILNYFSERSRHHWRLVLLLDVSARSFVFWLVSSLALADRREPYRQSRLVLWVAFDRSLDQPFVGEPFARHGVNEAVEPRHGVVLYIALIEAECELIDVAIKMFRAGMVVDADQAALESGENAFHPVRGHAVADIFARAMVDGSVFETRTLNADICASLIGMQDRTDLNMPVDSGLNRLFVGVRNRHADSATAPLPHSENGGFPDRAATGLKLLGLMLVLFDSTDIGFVDFDDAFELAQVVAAASFPQAVQHEPSRLLRDPDLLGELHARDALAGRHKQIHRVNPLVQRNVAALEYRASAHRKVFLALVTAIEAFLPNRDALAQSADWAFRPIRPQTAFQIGPGRLLIREHLEKLEGRNGAFGHRSNLNFLPKSRLINRGSQVYNSPF